MDLKDACRIFLNLYFFAGLTSYSTSRRNHCLFQISRYLQLLFNVLLVAYAIYRLNMPHILKTLSQMDVLLVTFYITVDLIRSIFVFFECVSHHRVISQIFDHYLHIQTYFVRHFDRCIDYHPFVREHRNKMLLLLGSYFLYVLVFFKKLYVSITSLLFIQQLTLMYVIFHIDMHCYHMVELNGAVERDIIAPRMDRVIFTTRPTRDSQWMIDRIKAYKCMHFHLWEASVLRNKVFGWCIFALLVNLFFDLIYTAFWVYNEIKNRTGMYNTCREYHFRPRYIN